MKENLLLLGDKLPANVPTKLTYVPVRAEIKFCEKEYVSSILI